MNVAGLGGRAVRRAQGIRGRLASRYWVSLGRADPDIVFIAGTGRSGTTWLAELLARSSRRRLVFEPFRNDRVPEWSGAASRQYIRPDDRESPFLEAARRILAPGFRNEWADYYNERFVTRGRIVKDIRANLMLRWLYEQFGPFPVIFLIRHPGAVAASWLREGWSVDPVAELLSQESLTADHLGPFSGNISSDEEPLDRLVHCWSIENYVALRQLAGTRSIVVLYENLVVQPELELTRIASLCGSGNRLAPRQLEMPSATTTPGVSYGTHGERLRAWQRQLGVAQAERIEKIVERYGLGGIYRPDGMPDASAASVLDATLAEATA